MVLEPGGFVIFAGLGFEPIHSCRRIDDYSDAIEALRHACRLHSNGCMNFTHTGMGTRTSWPVVSRLPVLRPTRKTTTLSVS